MKVAGKNNTEKLENLIESYFDDSPGDGIDLDDWLGDDIEIVSVKKSAKRL